MSTPALPGLDEACAALAAGRPVVVPNADPMSYLVVATGAGQINALKGRPIGQAVGITVSGHADRRALLPVLDVPADAAQRMFGLMRRELLSFLVPLRRDACLPDWIAPAVRDGHLGLFAGCWAPLAPVWDRFPRLFASSANRTGQPPAATAAQARAAFGPAVPIVDGDALRTPGATRGATTILRLAPDGRLHLHRSGAQDHGTEPGAFLRRLATPDPDPSAVPAAEGRTRARARPS